MGFKDMMKSFLYENVENDELEEEEEEEVSAPAREPEQTVPQEEPAQQPVQTWSEPENIPEEIQSQNLTGMAIDERTDDLLASEDQQSAGGSFLSRIDEAMEGEEQAVSAPASRPALRKNSSSRRPLRSGPKEEYSAVLSPIFGNLPEEKKDHQAIHDAINLPKPVETLDMVEVISPMYGSENKEDHSTYTAVRREKKAAPRKDSHAEDLPATEEELSALELISDDARPADLADYLLSGTPSSSAHKNTKSARSAAHKKGGSRK